MGAMIRRCMVGLTLAALTLAGARAEEAVPAAPTLGDRVAASETTRKIKNFSERLDTGVGHAFEKAGSATSRAGNVVGGAFESLDTKVSGWMARWGFKPSPEAPGGPGTASPERDD